MGEAKRRGTLQDRIAQAAERKRLEDAARHEKYLQVEAERRAKLAALPPEKRKEIILGSSRSRSRGLMLAAAMALALPPMRRK